MDKEKYLKAKELANKIRELESNLECLNQYVESKDPGLDWAYDVGDVPVELKKQLLLGTRTHLKDRLIQAQKEFEAL